MIIPDLYLSGERLLLWNDPVQHSNGECICENVLLLSNNDCIFLQVDTDHVKGNTLGQTETSPLTDGVKWDPLVHSYDVPSPVHDGTGHDRFFQPCRKKRMIGVVLDETNFLTFSLIMNEETELLCLSSNILLTIFS